MMGGGERRSISVWSTETPPKGVATWPKLPFLTASAERELCGDAFGCQLVCMSFAFVACVRVGPVGLVIAVDDTNMGASWSVGREGAGLNLGLGFKRRLWWKLWPLLWVLLRFAEPGLITSSTSFSSWSMLSLDDRVITDISNSFLTWMPSFDSETFLSMPAPFFVAVVSESVTAVYRLPS